MLFTIYDADGKKRFSSTNWPMARAALDVVISEGPKRGFCPDLMITLEPEEDEDDT